MLILELIIYSKQTLTNKSFYWYKMHMAFIAENDNLWQFLYPLSHKTMKTLSLNSQCKGLLHHPISTFLTLTFSFLIRTIPNQNTMHCFAFLPWFEEMNLGLVRTACK